MQHLLARMTQTFFGASLDLRLRLFNVLVFVSGIFCAIITVTVILAGFPPLLIVVDGGAMVFCFALLWYSSRSGRYRLCQIIFMVGSFFILFPFLFFITGGYYGGLIAFFVFAPVFTVFMLEGKTAFVLSALEILLYAGVCVVAYLYPESYAGLDNDAQLVISNVMCVSIVGASLAATMYAQMRMYRNQQKKLDEQNEILAQANRAKTEFLSNASHEMRTPLTVISVNVQTVTDILDELAVKDAEAESLLKNAQGEIMRLARMVGGMLMLASMSEGTDRQRTDLSALLQSGAEMLGLHLSKRGNAIETQIEKGLEVFGNADLLAQVLANILQNAGAHMERGTVAIRAGREGGMVVVSVRDTGSGIAPELLPRVFERGVSTGGTGFGLPLCKTVIESHGGKIGIESQPGVGTTVFYTLPVYEGQFGKTAVG